MSDAPRTSPSLPEFVVTIAPQYASPDVKAAGTRVLTLTAHTAHEAALFVAKATTGSKSSRLSCGLTPEGLPSESKPCRFFYEDRRAKATHADWVLIVRLSDAEISRRATADAEARAKQAREREEAEPHLQVWQASLAASPFRRVCVDSYEISFEFKDAEFSSRISVERRSRFSDTGFSNAKISGSSWGCDTSAQADAMLRTLSQARALAAFLDATPPDSFLGNIQDLSPKASVIRHLAALGRVVRALACAEQCGTAAGVTS